MTCCNQLGPVGRWCVPRTLSETDRGEPSVGMTWCKIQLAHGSGQQATGDNLLHLKIKTQKSSSDVSNATRESRSRILPNHINEAFSEWGCVTKERMASALNFSPQATSYWSSRQRDRVFGANHDAFATKYTGFSACHPECDCEETHTFSWSDNPNCRL
mgnify:CR=1 FL=1